MAAISPALTSSAVPSLHSTSGRGGLLALDAPLQSDTRDRVSGQIGVYEQTGVAGDRSIVENVDGNLVNADGGIPSYMGMRWMQQLVGPFDEADFTQTYLTEEWDSFGSANYNVSVYTEDGDDILSYDDNQDTVDNGGFGYFKYLTLSQQGQQFQFSVDVRARIPGDIGKLYDLRMGSLGGALATEGRQNMTLTADWVRYTIIWAADEVLTQDGVFFALSRDGNDAANWARGCEIRRSLGEVLAFNASVTSPSNWESDVINSKFHYSTYNGNTVDGNGVVTYITGAPILDGGGFMFGPMGSDQFCKEPLDIDSAAWVLQGGATKETGVFDITPFGDKKETMRIECTSANDGLEQAIGGGTVGDSNFAVYMKHYSGSIPDVEITADGTNWAAASLDPTDEWHRINVSTTLSSATMGFRAPNTNTSFLIYMGQFSDNNVDEEIDIFNFASVIRNRKAKGLYFPNNTVINDVGGTIYAEIMISALVAATKPILTITNTDDGILGANNTTGNTLEAFDGTNTATIDGFASGFGIYNKVALRWGSGKMRLFVDGVGGTEADYAGTWVRSITRLQIGPTAAPDDSDRERSCYGRMRNLKVYSGTLPDDEIITLTSA